MAFHVLILGTHNSAHRSKSWDECTTPDAPRLFGGAGRAFELTRQALGDRMLQLVQN